LLLHDDDVEERREEMSCGRLAFGGDTTGSSALFALASRQLESGDMVN
jgi:hypothetical protein